jgi:hypothetical protein
VPSPENFSSRLPSAPQVIALTGGALDLDRVAWRDAVPIRVAFLHVPSAGGGPAALARIVRQRRAVALDLLLFAHAIWPLSQPEPIEAPSSQWLRAIGLDARPGTRSAISRAWTWLEAQRLIRTRPRGRIRAIEILREDASGQLWKHPYDEGVAYFKLPHAYWTGRFSADLSLAAKAVLLIALSLQARGEPYFELPVSRGSEWYGLSEDSVRRGLRELRDIRLLRTWSERRNSGRSPTGYAFDRRHSLNPMETVGRRRNPAADDISF